MTENNYDQSSEKEKQYESSKQIDKSLLVANATALAVTIASLSTIISGGTNSRMDKDTVYDAAMVVILFTFGVLSGMASTIFILMIEQMSEKLKKELNRLKRRLDQSQKINGGFELSVEERDITFTIKVIERRVRILTVLSYIRMYILFSISAACFSAGIVIGAFRFVGFILQQ